jgi:hypothetical protein
LNTFLTVNLLLSTAIFFAAAKIYILPRIGRWTPSAIVLPILLMHSFRHFGLMFLTRGATYPGIPAPFAVPAAIGDFVTALLAITAVPGVRKDFEKTRLHLWVFNIFGVVDLLASIALGVIYNVSNYLGPSYWIAALWAPALLVTHYITWVVLRHRRASGE